MKKLIAMSLLALTASASQAALINGDWLSEGDGQVYVDTESGLAWLDFNNTRGYSYNQAVSQFASQGWSVATHYQVEGMYNSLLNGDDFELERNSSGNYYSPGNSQQLRHLYNISGNVYSTWSNSGYVFNNIYSTSDNGGSGFSTLMNGQNSSGTAWAKITMSETGSIYNNPNQTGVRGGVFMVTSIDNIKGLDGFTNEEFEALKTELNSSASVPLPATGALLGLALAGLSLRRKSA